MCEDDEQILKVQKYLLYNVPFISINPIEFYLWRDDITEKIKDNNYRCWLSMGMTGDYKVAIEEGVTFVRVGTGIFGERNYNI